MRQFLAVTFILGLIAVPTVWFLDPGSVESVIATVKPGPEPVASRPLMSDEDKQRVGAIASAGKDTAAGSHAIIEAMSAVAAGLGEALPENEPGDGATQGVVRIVASNQSARSSLDLAPAAIGAGGDGVAIAGLVGDLPVTPGGDTASGTSGTPSRAADASVHAAPASAPVVVILRHRPLAMATAGPAWLLRSYPTAISWYDLV